MNIEKAYLMPVSKYLLEAAEELGYPIRDPNPYGPNTDGNSFCSYPNGKQCFQFMPFIIFSGFSPMEFYMKFGRRADAYHGSLLPVLHRRNLVVRKFSYAKKILIRDSTAYGVQYDRHGHTFYALAKKEVILSAGTLMSPKLLMLSGIGPKAHLKDVGVSLKAYN